MKVHRNIGRCFKIIEHAMFQWNNSPTAFCGKNPECSIASIRICFCVLIFFQKWRSVTDAKNGIYFCSARHISFHIGVCHLKFAPFYSPTDTLSAHIIFILLVLSVTSPVMILDFFPEMTLGDGLKNSRIRANGNNWSLFQINFFHGKMENYSIWQWCRIRPAAIGSSSCCPRWNNQVERSVFF